MKQLPEGKVTTSVALPVELHRRLADAAHAARISQGEAIRLALSAFLLEPAASILPQEVRHA